MSELLQSGQHPDADQLSAFVEHALPAHERQETLAHLAICPDCRAIVSLSLPPLEELPKPEVQPVRKPMFSGWRLALPAAAAFAALVVIVHIRNASSIKSSTPTTQIAISQPREPVLLPPHPSAAAPEAVSPIANPLASGARANAKSPVVSKPQINEPVDRPQTAVMLPHEGRTLTQPAQSQQLPASGFAQLHGSASGAGRATNGATTSVQIPATIALDRLAPSAPGTPANNPGQSSPATMPLRQQAVAGATPSPVVGDAVTVAAANQTVDVTSASPIATFASTNNLALSESKNIVSKNILAEHPLPSRLPTLSTVSTAHQILALDTHNSLFLSDDGGQHWRTVSPQWHGRAVKVDLVSSSIHGQDYVAGQAPANSSSVTGTVKDASGAAIPDASIALSDATAQVVRTVKTDHCRQLSRR